jgi:hypothetical protein
VQGQGGLQGKIIFKNLQKFRNSAGFIKHRNNFSMFFVIALQNENHLGFVFCLLKVFKEA